MAAVVSEVTEVECIHAVFTDPSPAIIQRCAECVVAHDRAEQPRLRHDEVGGLELIGVEARDDCMHGVEHRHARIYPWRSPLAAG